MESLSYQILNQKKKSKKLKTLANDIVPISIEWNLEGKQPLIEFSGGGSGLGSCIHCINPPCIEYTNDELYSETFQEFPLDRNVEVCPTKAINWPQDSDSPIINSEFCIFCGICVSRCPVAAIYLDYDTGTAILNDQPNEYFLLQNEEVSEQSHNLLIQKFSHITEKGIFILENENILQLFFEKFMTAAKVQNTQFPNLLVRNLMMEIGINTLMTRRGDTNIRMDIVFEQTGNTIGTCEVELGNDVLDAPRNILDNVAVLVSRYNISKDKIMPLVVTLSLPNRRSEYWNVIKDIKQVLNIKINSMTVGTLIILVWNRVKLPFNSNEIFYADSEQNSIKNKIESVLNRKLNIKEGYPGLFESHK